GRGRSAEGAEGEGFAAQAAADAADPSPTPLPQGERAKNSPNELRQCPHCGHAPRYCSHTERSVRGLRPVMRSTSSDCTSMKPSRIDWPNVTMPSLAHGIGPSGTTSDALRATPSESK